MKQLNTTSVQDLRHLHKKLLGILGNPNPSEQQMDLISILLSSMVLYKAWTFPHLTEREADCLTLAAKGMTSSETAQVLGIKSSTVETYREKIKRKLECKTMAHAVFKGLQFGYPYSEINALNV